MFIFFKSTSIYQTFFPFYWMLKLFGFACYDLNLEEKKIKISRTNKLQCFSFIFLYLLILIFMFICGEMESSTEESLLVNNGWYFLYIAQIGFSVLIVGCNMYYINVTKSILKTLDDFDILTNHQTNWIFTLNHSKHRSYVVYFSIINVILCIMKFIFCFFVYNGLSFVEFLYVVGALLGVELTALVSFQFTFFSFCIKCRQEVLLKNFKINFEDTLMEARFFIQIDNFSYCYAMLSKVVDKINSSYSIQVKSFINYHDNLMI